MLRSSELRTFSHPGPSSLRTEVDVSMAQIPWRLSTSMPRSWPGPDESGAPGAVNCATIRVDESRIAPLVIGALRTSTLMWVAALHGNRCNPPTSAVNAVYSRRKCLSIELLEESSFCVLWDESERRLMLVNGPKQTRQVAVSGDRGRILFRSLAALPVPELVVERGHAGLTSVDRTLGGSSALDQRWTP